MTKMNYEDFMKQKGEDVAPPAVEEKAPEEKSFTPLPPRPKEKSNVGTPIFIGAMLFLLIIAAVALYNIYAGGNNQTTEAVATKATKAPVAKGQMKAVHADEVFSVYNEKVDSWADMKDGNVPFATMILTGPASKRNIFTINNTHTIRCGPDTKFMIDSSKPLQGFKQQVIMMVQSGKVWIEGAGDEFEVTTTPGVIKGGGGNFEFSVSDDNSVNIYAWDDKVTFIPKNNPEKPTVIEKGKMLLINSSEIQIPGVIDKNKDKWSEWQKWNHLVFAEEVNSDSNAIPEWPKKVEVHPDIASKKEEQVEKADAERPQPVEKTPQKLETPVQPPPPEQADNNQEDNKPPLPKFGNDEPKQPASNQKLPSINMGDQNTGGVPTAKRPAPQDNKNAAPGQASQANGQPGALQAPPMNKDVAPQPPQPSQPPMMKAHNPNAGGGSGNSGGGSSGGNYSSGSNEEAPTSLHTSNPLDNKQTLNRVPGTGLHDKPVGPSDQ